MSATVDVRVDFNAVTAGGLVKATRRRASGELRVGQEVRAHDPGETESHLARVASIDESTGRVLLDVNWEDNGARHVRMISNPGVMLRHQEFPARILRTRVLEATQLAVLLRPSARSPRVP